MQFIRDACWRLQTIQTRLRLQFWYFSATHMACKQSASRFYDRDVCIARIHSMLECRRQIAYVSDIVHVWRAIYSSKWNRQVEPQRFQHTVIDKFVQICVNNCQNLQIMRSNTIQGTGTNTIFMILVECFELLLSVHTITKILSFIESVMPEVFKINQ